MKFILFFLLLAFYLTANDTFGSLQPGLGPVQLGPGPVQPGQSPVQQFSGNRFAADGSNGANNFNGANQFNQSLIGSRLDDEKLDFSSCPLIPSFTEAQEQVNTSLSSLQNYLVKKEQEQDQACSKVTRDDYQAFKNYMSNYQESLQAGGGGGQSGARVTCNNYKQVLNIRYRNFLASLDNIDSQAQSTQPSASQPGEDFGGPSAPGAPNTSGPASNTPFAPPATDDFSSCNQSPSPQTCAALRLGTLMTENEDKCEELAASRSRESETKAEIDSYNNAQKILETMAQNLSNPECVSQLKDQAPNFLSDVISISSNLWLSGLSFGPAGATANLLGGVLSSLIGNLDNPSYSEMLNDLNTAEDSSKSLCILRELEQEALDCDYRREKKYLQPLCLIENFEYPFGQTFDEAIDNLKNISTAVDDYESKKEKLGKQTGNQQRPAEAESLVLDDNNFTNLINNFNNELVDGENVSSFLLGTINSLEDADQNKFKKHFAKLYGLEEQSPIIISRAFRDYKKTMSIVNDFLKDISSIKPVPIDGDISDEYFEKYENLKVKVQNNLSNLRKFNNGSIDSIIKKMVEMNKELSSDNSSATSRNLLEYQALQDGTRFTLARTQQVEGLRNDVNDHFERHLASLVRSSKLRDNVFNELERYKKIIDENNSLNARKDRPSVWNTRIEPLLRRCQYAQNLAQLSGDENYSINPERSMESDYLSSCRMFMCEDKSGLQSFKKKSQCPKNSNNEDCLTKYKEFMCSMNDGPSEEVIVERIKNRFIAQGKIYN